MYTTECIHCIYYKRNSNISAREACMYLLHISHEQHLQDTNSTGKTFYSLSKISKSKSEDILLFSFFSFTYGEKVTLASLYVDA